MLVVAACGSDDDGGGAAATADGGDGMSLSITTPDDGAELGVPFTVEFDSNVELGPTETGAHHVHLFWDGDDSEYLVVEADAVEVTDAPEGEHTLNASLRNADHSPAGAETEITVNVGAGAAGGGETGSDGTSDDDAFDY
jgi:hypothetical protein